jgi:hypothetical protein
MKNRLSSKVVERKYILNTSANICENCALNLMEEGAYNNCKDHMRSLDGETII